MPMPTATPTDPKNKHSTPPFEEPSQGVPGRGAAMRNKADHREESYSGFDRLYEMPALITSGYSGIGRAIATAYAREGLDVALSFLPQAYNPNASLLVYATTQGAIVTFTKAVAPLAVQRPTQPAELAPGDVYLVSHDSIGSVMDLTGGGQLP